MVALGDASSKLACYDGMRYGHHADGRNLSEIVQEEPHGGLRRRGAQAHTRRHLHTHARVLRKLLRPRDEGAPAHLRRIQKSLPTRRDFMICPITPALAYKRGLSETDPVRMYLARRVHDDSEPRWASEHQPEPRLYHRRAAYERAAARGRASATRSCSPAPP